MVERVSLWMSARRCVECGANETLCNAPLPEAKTYPIDFMSIETIGEAHSLGWRVVARCDSKSSRECIYRKELDMETLVWTRAVVAPGKPLTVPTMRLAADCGAV
jgi:hypothetical protein